MSSKRDPLKDFVEWQERSVRDNKFQCTPISFKDSREWHLDRGQLRHRTGGWFSIAGIEAESRLSFLDGQQQAIIIQRQIAINGFLVRATNGSVEVLFQGRVEPGNIDGMQLAPTVQSTVSNYKRVHGGRPTAFVEHFLDPEPNRVLLDMLQSEEATRYLGKYNRNIVVTTADNVEVPDGFKWYSLPDIRRFAVSSNILNSDARSVLSTLDWNFLAGPAAPFEGHRADEFGAELRTSYVSTQQEPSTLDIIKWLTRLRARAGVHAQVLPIAALNNWVVEEDAIRERNTEHGFCVRQFLITALGREVESWDQPLIDSQGIGRLTLAFQRRRGVLQTLVKASHEIGYLEGVQLSASISIAPGAAPNSEDRVEEMLIELIANGKDATILQACRQSEEGGRFYRDENEYEIVLLDASIQLPQSDNYQWLTLSQVCELIAIPGMFSIEFRGVLALLLAYL